MEMQLEELKAKVEQSSAALAAFERELNVINPEEKTSILSARLLQLNSEYTQAQADRVKKETAFYSVKSGAAEAAQVSSPGESLRKLSEQLDEAQRRFAEVNSHYGKNHPEYKRAASQTSELQKQIVASRENIARRVEVEFEDASRRERLLLAAVSDTKREFDRLNARSVEYQSFKREAEADKKLYEELVHKIKEAGINASFQSSSIRVADLARPSARPVSPNIPLNVLLALLISSIVAIGAAILSDLLDTTVRDPEQVTRTLRTPVITSLPAVKNWRAQISASRAAASMALVPSSQSYNQHVGNYREAIRTLRNAVLLTHFDRRIRTILFSSATPSEGKSTAAANMAIAHAEQQFKTLLIDGDLRRPSLHQILGIDRMPGLSEVLRIDLPWRGAVVQMEGNPNLHVLVAGSPTENAANGVGAGLTRILDEAAREYDLVILDSPPMLGFAEPLHMAAVVDGVILIARAGRTDRKAVASVISILQKLRANVLGIVLNDVHKMMNDSYYHYADTAKYYRTGNIA
jgi:capsular exopolysaccharide synthesis family protein